MKVERTEQQIGAADIGAAASGMVPEAKRRAEVIVGATAFLKQRAEPRPGADDQRGIAFTRLNNRVIVRAYDIIGMDFRRRPLGPCASGALRNGIVKRARLRDLHFGDE